MIIYIIDIIDNFHIYDNICFFIYIYLLWDQRKEFSSFHFFFFCRFLVRKKKRILFKSFISIFI